MKLAGKSAGERRDHRPSPLCHYGDWSRASLGKRDTFYRAGAVRPRRRPRGRYDAANRYSTVLGDVKLLQFKLQGADGMVTRGGAADLNGH